MSTFLLVIAHITRTCSEAKGLLNLLILYSTYGDIASDTDPHSCFQRFNRRKVVKMALDIPADYARILMRMLLKQPRKYINNAYEGQPADLEILCDNLSEVPTSLYADMIDMFVSHLDILRDGREISPVHLKLMDQSLRGIRLIMGFGSTPTDYDKKYSCHFTLADHWSRILDCAEFIVDADFDGACIGHDHLEKQISAVLHSATSTRKLTEKIHGPFGERTARIASRLLMTQDNQVGPPWSNEETLLSLYSCDEGRETLFHLLQTFGDDLSQIIDMLTTRLRLFSKGTLSTESVFHMKQLLYLTGQLINAYGFGRHGPENVKAFAAIPKSLLSIATALDSRAGSDSSFRFSAAIAISYGLVVYTNLSGYRNLSLAIAIVRLGLFEVILAVHSPIVQIMEPRKQFQGLLDLVNAVISQVLPEFLMYGSFIEVVAAALRPLVEDRRLLSLSEGPFGDAWVRFERLLLERYVIKKMWNTETKNSNVHGICHNDACQKVGLLHNFKQCSGCVQVRYCSMECQKVHWRECHRLMCKDLNCSDIMTMKQQLRHERDKGLLAIIVTSDIMRHRHSLNEQASKKYPGIPPQDTCFVIEHVKSPVSPDVQIQAVPIEGTQWTQYFSQDPTAIADHYERLRLGKHSNLILMQRGLTHPRLQVLHSRNSLETETYSHPVVKAERLRSSAFDSDGTRLQSEPDLYDEVLHQVDLTRSKENGWICYLEDRRMDVFEAVEVIHKDVMGV